VEISFTTCRKEEKQVEVEPTSTVPLALFTTSSLLLVDNVGVDFRSEIFSVEDTRVRLTEDDIDLFTTKFGDGYVFSDE